MTITVFIQHTDRKPLKASLCALTAAEELATAWNAGPVVAVVLGPGASEVGASLPASGDVLVSDDVLWERYFAPRYARMITAAMNEVGSNIFVAAATSTGKDVAPRIAALLKAGQASDIIGVNGDGSLVRPMYAGDVIATVEITTAPKVVTVRASAFPPRPGSGAPTVRTVATPTGVDGSSETSLGEVVELRAEKRDRPDLGDASIVVSGGRALGSSENFEKVIFPLADALGAAVGASRAAVDSGYAPNDWQVGQTGKIVAPELYVAVGISGAIQHLAGMKDSKTIVAINKDKDAPIFEVADYGLSGDLFDVVPTLTNEIRKVKGQ